MQGPKYTKAMYMDLMSLLYDLLAKVRKEGLMSIEADVDEPHESAIFANYPSILADHQMVEFITDYLRLMVGGNLNAFELENLMDNEIETHHQEGEIPVHCITKLADSMPAFGIVAAVMGVVHTMASVGLAAVGAWAYLVAQALVGTFLGHSAWLWFGRAACRSAGAEAWRVHKDVAMHPCYAACQHQWLCPGAWRWNSAAKYSTSTERPSFSELEECVRQPAPSSANKANSENSRSERSHG